MTYHRVLNIVPCAIQQNLAVYPFYIYQFVSANPKLLIQPSPMCLPLGNHQFILNVGQFVNALSHQSVIATMACVHFTHSFLSTSWLKSPNLEDESYWVTLYCSRSILSFDSGEELKREGRVILEHGTQP